MPLTENTSSLMTDRRADRSADLVTHVRATVPRRFDCDDDVVLIALPDQLIVSNRQLLKQLVLDAIAEGKRAFVLDFSGTGYVDASALGVLVSIGKHVREAPGVLTLAALNDDLITLLEITHIDMLFRLSDTVATAVHASTTAMPT